MVATEQEITLEYKVRRKEGKRKVTEEIQTTIPFTDIKQTLIQRLPLKYNLYFLKNGGYGLAI